MVACKKLHNCTIIVHRQVFQYFLDDLVFKQMSHWKALFLWVLIQYALSDVVFVKLGDTITTFLWATYIKFLYELIQYAHSKIVFERS